LRYSKNCETPNTSEKGNNKILIYYVQHHTLQPNSPELPINPRFFAEKTDQTALLALGLHGHWHDLLVEPAVLLGFQGLRIRVIVSINCGKGLESRKKIL